MHHRICITNTLRKAFFLDTNLTVNDMMITFKISVGMIMIDFAIFCKETRIPFRMPRMRIQVRKSLVQLKILFAKYHLPSR